MTIEVLMPALSPTMEEGTLAKWLVKEGDTVEAGDVIAEIETDKATMEVEAVDEGTVGKILIGAGTEGVKVNELIAVLLEEGEDKSAAEDAGKNGGGAQKSAKKDDSEKKSEPQSENMDEAPKQTTKQSSASTSPSPAPKANGRLKASPLARRLAEEAGLDLAALKGSGPRGRIIKSDVEEAKKTGAPSTAKAPVEAPAIRAAQLGLKEGTYDEVPLGSIRKTIAQRLTVAKRDVPHYYLTVDCEIDKLLKARKDLNDSAPKDKDGKPRYKISVNDFVIKACAQALRLAPGVNASWAGDKIIQHHHADIAMAVAIPEGLITPIIWEADEKGLAEIAREASELAGKAKAKKLMPEQYQGGSFSVSNLGMFGIKHFTAVINPPHAAILAVGAGEQRPVVKNGALAVATVMTVTLSCDHRVVDGAMGADFLSHFKRFIEDPVTMLL